MVFIGFYSALCTKGLQTVHTYGPTTDSAIVLGRTVKPFEMSQQTNNELKCPSSLYQWFR